jgi:regulation of enolase protein 1 (concanavalin A-like superfamily)
MKATKCVHFFSCALVLITLCGVSAQEKPALIVPSVPFTLFWENTPKNFKVMQKGFMIEAGEKTDMFRDPNATYNTDNAPKLLFEPDSNFVLITSIRHSFENKWDGGAIVLKSDSAHWIKFCFEKDYTGAHRVVSVVTKDISDDCNSIAINSDQIFYKVAKAGNVVTLYYSENRQTWFLIRHLQFEFDQRLKIGFLAQSPTGKSCSVIFENIHYKAKKIKDPYMGE